MPQLPDRVYLGMEYDCVYIYAFPTATQAIAWSNAEDEVPRYIWSVDTADARSYRVEVTPGTYQLVEVGPRFAPSLDLAALRRRLGPARSEFDDDDWDEPA